MGKAKRLLSSYHDEKITIKKLNSLVW